MTEDHLASPHVSDRLIYTAEIFATVQADPRQNMTPAMLTSEAMCLRNRGEPKAFFCAARGRGIYRFA